MKYIALFLALGIFFLGCEKEKVEAPNAEYDLQVFNNVKGAWENKEQPYNAKVNQAIKVVAKNNSEYNSFYQGDSILIGQIMVKRIFIETPRYDYRGVGLNFNNDTKRGSAEINYPVSGTFTMTFVTCAVGDGGDIVEYNINNKYQIVIE